MGSPTRFPHGVTNVDKTSPFGMMGQLSPLTMHSFFADFDTFTAAQWVITRVGTTPTEALTDADGGVLLLTMAATDDSSSFLQKVGESYLPASGKKLFFASRFKISDATQSDFVMGLQVLDTTPLDVTDGIYFQKDDGDANVDFYCSKDATTGRSTTTAWTTISSDTYLELAFYFDGKRYIYLYKNNVLTTRVDLTATLATYLPDTELTVSFGVQNGEAVAKTMSVDYIFVAQER